MLADTYYGTSSNPQTIVPPRPGGVTPRSRCGDVGTSAGSCFLHRHLSVLMGVLPPGRGGTIVWGFLLTLLQLILCSTWFAFAKSHCLLHSRPCFRCVSSALLQKNRHQLVSSMSSKLTFRLVFDVIRSDRARIYCSNGRSGTKAGPFKNRFIVSFAKKNQAT